MKTKFAGPSPFPTAPKVAKVVKYVDPTKLVIANDPLPSGRASPEKKYDALFSKMKPGQCLVCESDEAGKIGHAMGVWLKNTGKPGSVRTTRNYEADGKGRVWLVAAAKKLKVAA